jgi:hypothetical protein
MQNSLISDREHKPLCDFLQGPRATTSFIVTPRDTLKTTIVGYYVLWRSLKNNCDFRALLSSRVMAQTEVRLDNIKKSIVHGERLREVFGELNGATVGYVWNNEEIDFAQRKSFSAKEHNIETTAEGGDKTGFHYNIFIDDDFVTLANAFSIGAMRKTMLYIAGTGPLLSERAGERSERLLINTPYANGDALEQLLDIYKDNCSIYRRRAYEPDGLDIIGMSEEDFVKAGGVLNYPICLPYKKLYEERISMKKSVSLFFSQYQLKALAAEDLIFNYKKVLEEVVKASDVPSGVRIYELIDPAGDPGARTGQRIDSDYTAIAMIGVLRLRKEDPYPHVFIIGLRCKVESPTLVVRAIVDMALRYNPSLIGIESTGLATTKHYVELELAAVNKLVKIIPLKPGGRSKEHRIMALEPLISLGYFHVVDSIDAYDELMSQIRLFTKDGVQAGHDDAIDAVSYIVDVLAEFGAPLQLEAPVIELSPVGLDSFELQHYNTWKERLSIGDDSPINLTKELEFTNV